MSKKKIITLALVAIVAITAIASASLAYFTDTKTADNTFTMGNVKITLDEAPVDEFGQAADGERVTGNRYGPSAVYPGAVLHKDPTVHNVGDYPAYIRATSLSASSARVGLLLALSQATRSRSVSSMPSSSSSMRASLLPELTPQQCSTTLPFRQESTT